MRGESLVRRVLTCLLATGVLANGNAASKVPPAQASAARYLDGAPGADWPGYGRSFGEQHYSPLTEVDRVTVGRLRLAWWLDLGPENSATQPIAVQGILYFATGYSIVQAVDATTGKRLWTYDPHAAEAAGLNLRLGWGSRGIAWWNGKIYTGTQDGRLIAIDARTGRPVWSAQTFDKDSARYISGAPRVFAGRVIIGHGSDFGKVRGYAATYDAETGKPLWRFYTVPGDPARGFENSAMEMAAKTWSGQWWQYGGGGTVWNAISYDPETDTVYLGTGNGYPWNRKVRSAGQGDNLFVCSIVAVDGRTGAYRWHYQVNPGESWDYNAAMDMALADITLGGKARKVLMTAPKNGFFYVIDRTNGRLISAQAIAKVNWTSGIDVATGRPVENPQAFFPHGETFTMWPSATGAHSWLPMAYSPVTGLAYIPVINAGMRVSDAGIDLGHWMPPLDRSPGGAVNMELDTLHEDPEQDTGALVAWSPVTQQLVWKIPYPTYVNGGVLATAGSLVFQGTVDGRFRAFDASTGKSLWSFDTHTPVIAPPISYSAGGRQYVSVLTGLGTTMGLKGKLLADYHVDPRSQARRVLTFALDGTAPLPPGPAPVGKFAADPTFLADESRARAGSIIYATHCMACHGWQVASGTHAPDLRRSNVPGSAEDFATVLGGAMVPQGMPSFKEFTQQQREDLRQYIRTETYEGRSAEPLR